MKKNNKARLTSEITTISNSIPKENALQQHEIDELHKLAQDLIRAQEQQRKEISRELHDNIAQVLAAATTRLALTRNKSNRSDVKQDLAKLRTDLLEALKSVQKFARDLRPPVLDSFCLCHALERYTESLRHRTNISIVFECNVQKHNVLDTEQRTNLFRIAQEAIHNIEKHSCASQAWIRLNSDNSSMRLEVGDNGHSFHADRATEAQLNGHLGLLTMRERAEMLGGILQIHAQPGVGTIIQASVPINGKNGKTSHNNKP